MYTLLFIALLSISAQEVTPHTSPTAATKNSSAISKLDSQKKTDKAKQAIPDKPKEMPCNQYFTCPPVEQGQAKSKEEQAKADSLDLLYRRYMWATIIGVCGAIIGLVILGIQTELTRRAANAAKQSADAYEKATRLTERADVLLHSAGIILSQITQVFDGRAHLAFKFKNFGRTRANNVDIRVRLIIPDCSDSFMQMPPLVLGANQDHTVSFESFINFLNKPTFDGIARGDIQMRFESWLVYADVFGAIHTTRDVGIFDSHSMRFRVEEHTAG